MNDSVLRQFNHRDAEIWTPISEIRKHILDATGYKSGRNSDTEFFILFAMKVSRCFRSISEFGRRKRSILEKCCPDGGYSRTAPSASE
ncbi:hypothetical protein A9Z06_33580 [Rhizobium sp. YK2]|nr:hypothetical protein A9Z06_33580 [Rhizobium sp. YK2]